jgi:hypothetical protein
MDMLEAMNHSNQGARLMEMGRYMEAHWRFTAAVNLITKYVSTKHTKHCNSHALTNIFRWSNEIYWHEAEDLDIAEEQAEIHAATFVYRRAVVFNDATLHSWSARDKKQPQSSWKHHIGVAIVFNMALCHHASGICLVSSQHFQLARRLYASALGACMADTDPMLKVAVLNNLGVLLHGHFMEYVFSRDCFAHLWKLLTILHQETAAVQIDIPTEVKSAVYLNIALLDSPPASPAA